MCVRRISSGKVSLQIFSAVTSFGIRIHLLEASELIKGIFSSSYSFQRETPSRFKKELLKSVIPSGESVIPIDGINKLLVNIGHSDDCLSKQEQDELLDEAVGHHDTRDVPINKIMSALFR